MKLIIGGSYQGKTEFALDRFHLSEDTVFVCTEDTTVLPEDSGIITHIERLALGCVRRGEEPADFWRAQALDGRILIADDVSCGVVPMDPVLRAWREASGRANNHLAQRADEVWRVFCGLGQQIK